MKLNYRIEGEGEPLVLLHGMGVTFSIWQNLVPLLRLHYKLIMVELPGHGLSPELECGTPYYSGSAQAIEELRQLLNIECWSLLGYSMGAWAAQAYIEKYPERVHSAIFVCPASLNITWSGLLKSLIGIDRAVPALGGWLLRGWRLDRLVTQLGFNGRRHPYADLWEREISAQPVQVIKRLLADLPGAGRCEMQAPPVPTLYIWGEQDTLVAHPPRARSCDVFLKGSHSLPMLAADEIARAITAFQRTAQRP